MKTLLLAILLAPATIAAASGQDPADESSPTTPTTNGETPREKAAPVQAAADVGIEEAVDAAVAWLVANQNENGSWGSHQTGRPIEVLADVPGSHDAFRIATTALCVMALEDCPRAGEAGFRAAERGLDYLVENYDVKRATPLEHYNVWSFGYALQCFGEHLVAQPEDPRAAAIRKACEHLLRKLVRYQTLDGGWGYLSMNDVKTFQPSDTSMSFTTASILVGVDRARKAGIEPDEKMVARAVDHLKRSRLSDGAFLYGEYLKYVPRMGINERKGSACRSPLCHYALDLFGEAPRPDDAYEHSMQDLLVRYAEFQRAALRRPIPHEAYYSISGYFYLYGHAYAAYVIPKLPEDDRQALADALVAAVLRTRDPDGSFWDYPLYSYHKPYGTAFALIALSRMLPGREG